MRFFADEQGGSAAGGRIPERSEQAEADRWDLDVLYPDATAWEADFARIETLVAPLEAMRGSLNQVEAVLAFFRADTQFDLLLDRLYTYAHLRADEDTANAANQARQDRMRATLAELGGRLAWVRPELLDNPPALLEEWIDDPRLEPYRYQLIKLRRSKPHSLSAAEETILSGAADLLAGPSQTYNLLSNADLVFPDVEMADGSREELSQGRFIRFLLNRNRDVRQRAFHAMYDTYGQVRNTLGCTLRLQVREHNFLARTRHYESALEAALKPDSIPVSLYDALVTATRAALPTFHRFVALRQRCLGVGDLDMYDMYVPLVPAADLAVSFDQAAEWVMAACEPLGEEYVAVLQSAFRERWIDRFENRGKRSGAYSSGCYESCPYVLMNYQGTLDDVFTLAHELGHSMHTWLANHSQPPQTAGYPIFIAEIASTVNEALLLRYLLGVYQDDATMRTYLLNHYCDGFKGTVYRQTMFAEFEKLIHDMAARGESLTPESLCDAYYELNAAYYGDVVRADRRIALEWSRIPHFYYNFYVYKYATSFCASQILESALVHDAGARDRYLGLLRAGGSDDPLTLVGATGVDLTDPRTFELAFAGFGERLSTLEAML